MGRTVPTFRQLIEETAQRWTKFRRALLREDQQHFDRLFLRARCFTQAGTYQCHDNPLETILLSLALDQEKRIARLEQLLQQNGNLHATSGVDTRPVPMLPGDDAMAADAAPDPAQTD